MPDVAGLCFVVRYEVTTIAVCSKRVKVIEVRDIQ